jgi:hypothetical protein
MPEECHRCGADLDSGTGSFCCPHCGSPQLYIAEAISEDTDTAATTGQAPPPRLPDVNWRSALRSAMLVAAVGAVLFGVASYVPALTIFSLLWILSAASIAIGMYRHREPALRMDASIGARIGLSVGLLMNSFLSVLLAIAGLLARFKTHTMAAFDAEMTQRMHDQIERALATNPAPVEVVRQMLSQEFRTGVMLAVLGMFAVLILAFSTVGGLLSGMMAVSRNRTA